MARSANLLGLPMSFTAAMAAFHKIDAPVLKKPVSIFCLRDKTGLALQFSDDRFEAFPDPVDNWIVWDREENAFAEVGTHTLWSLSQSRAEAFCFLLNKLFSKADQRREA
jgi:hypothetical protein